jgi:hypothetical protein
MRVDAKEACIEGDENRDVENGIGTQLVQLNHINEQKSPKELVNRSGETAKEEIREDYPVPFGRIGGRFVPRDLHLPIVSEKP